MGTSCGSNCCGGAKKHGAAKGFGEQDLSNHAEQIFDLQGFEGSATDHYEHFTSEWGLMAGEFVQEAHDQKRGEVRRFTYG